MQTKDINTVFILLTDEITIELHNVALTSEYNLNLILLGQLQESGITYYDNLGTITLMRGNKIITYAKKSHNLFTLNLAIPDQVMSPNSKAMAIMTRAEQLIQLVEINVFDFSTKNWSTSAIYK